MSVFSRIKGFLARHKNKFLVGSIIVGGSILLTKYGQKKLIEWQEKETKIFFERNRRHQHFESIGGTCNKTVLNLSPALIEKVLSIDNIDEIVNGLKANPENKLEMWNNLKVKVFCKAACMVYSIVVLVITLRIQLNIVGGYLYKNPSSVTTEMQEKYLFLCENFLNVGIPEISDLIEQEVKPILENVDLKKQLRLSDLEAIFWSLQTAIAANQRNPIDKLKDYILPEELINGNGIYRNILEDTSDLLESDEIKSLATHCINRGFMQLTDEISKFYTNSDDSGQFQNLNDSKKPVVKLLPIIKGLLSHQSFPNAFISSLNINEKLQKLGANIYEGML